MHCAEQELSLIIGSHQGLVASGMVRCTVLTCTLSKHCYGRSEAHQANISNVRKDLRQSTVQNMAREGPPAINAHPRKPVKAMSISLALHDWQCLTSLHEPFYLEV